MIEPKLYKNNQWIVLYKGEIIYMDIKFKMAPTRQNLTLSYTKKKTKNTSLKILNHLKRSWLKLTLYDPLLSF